MRQNWRAKAGMDQEIEKYLKIALDSSVSSYYRKDAIRQLGRLRKSVELGNAVIKVLNDVDDPSLQKEAMDLTAQFALTEAVNLILPISVGKGVNARHAINILAKIGGIKAYKCLKELAAAPGFDLSKTAAKRAMEDMLRREPDLDKEEDSSSSLISGAQDIFNDIKETVTETISSTVEEAEPEKKFKATDVNVEEGKLKREIDSVKNKNNSLANLLSEKNAKVEELEEKLRQFKKNDKTTVELKEVKKTLHESRNETAAIKASFEKQLALMKGKLISLEEENDDLMKRHSRKLVHHKKSGGGCLPIFIFFGIFFLIAWFIMSSLFSDKPKFDNLPDSMKIKIMK